MASPDKSRTVNALRMEWAQIDRLLTELDEDDWSAPSPLPGWDVRANVVHIFGTEAMLLGERPAVSVDGDALDHVRNPIGAMNEAWIATFATASPSELIDAFRSRTAQRLAVLEGMPQATWDEVGFTPAGQAPYGRFMQIRVFDCWMHEQDIRAALGRPGHDSGLPVDVSLDEMATAMGFVVGKQAAAPAGTTVTFDLTGPAARQIHVEVGDRAVVVDQLAGPATVTLTMPVIAYTRIAGGRADADGHRADVSMSGDTELGERVLANLRYTI